MHSRTARAHQRRKYSNPFVDKYMPCIGPNEGLIFNAPLIRDDRPLYSAAGTTAMSTYDVDADGTIPNYWQDNLLRDATLNIPRITGDGVLSEVASTNLCLQSEALNTTWATNNATVTPNSIAAPDGNTTADTIVDAGSGANINQSFNGTLTDNLQYTISVFVKEGDAAAFTLALLDSSASYVARAKTDFQWTAGVLSVKATDAGTNTIEAFPNGWYRVSVTTPVNVVVGANNNRIFWYVTEDGAGDTGKYHYGWGAQFEQQAAPTSYIPTTSAAVTRDGEDLDYPTSGNIIAASGTLLLAFRLNAIQTGTDQLLFSFLNYAGGAGGGVATVASADAKVNWDAYDGETVKAALESTSALSADTTYVGAFVWAENDFRMYIDGGDEQSDDNGTAPSGINSSLFLGQGRANTKQTNGSFKHLLIYNRALSAGEIGEVLHINCTEWLAGTGWAPAA